MKILLLSMLFTQVSYAHLRKNDVVTIKNKYSDRCLSEKNLFNNCDKVDKFKVAEFYDYKDVYELDPIVENDCKIVEIYSKNVDYCLEQEKK